MLNLIKLHYIANNIGFCLALAGLSLEEVNMSKQIGDLIRELRVERKITQIELAQYADVTLGTINKLENNKANVTLETLMKVLDVFGYEISAKKKDLRNNLSYSELI